MFFFFNYDFNFNYNFIDPGASQSHKQDDVHVTPKAAVTAVTISNKTIKLEDRESAASKNKRQRRQRTHAEMSIKEEEKKVIVSS